MENTAKWVLDPNHSELTFKVKHLMISHVKGGFSRFTVEVDGEDIFKSKLRVTAEADSIDTNNPERDEHLKSADFFDVAQHPEIVFESTAITQKAGEAYELKGLLTLKGITKEITLQAEFGGVSRDPWGNEKAGFSVTGSLNRKDWGLNWNAALETGGVLVSEEVKIFAEIQLIHQTS